MRPKATVRTGGARARRGFFGVLTLLGVGLLLAGQAAAQVQPPSPEPGIPAPLPILKPRDPHTPAEVSAFVERPSANDSIIEIFTGQSRILTLKERMKVPAVVAVGDPSVVEFTILNNPRQIRILAVRVGVTDLSVVTADDRVYTFEIHVVADLDPLRLQLRAAFPDATLKVTPIRDDVIVEGQARDTAQVGRILETIRAYMSSVANAQRVKRQQQTQGQPGTTPGQAPPPGPNQPTTTPRPGEPATPPPATEPGAVASPEQRGQSEIQAVIPEPRVINLIKVPGSQQVLLKVRVAELNRTGMRQIGADFLSINPNTGAIVGTEIGGATIAGLGTFRGDSAAGTLTTSSSGIASGAVNPMSPTTVFGIFPSGHFEFLLTALRRNTLLKILAEPNLVAMNGHQASFLAGGEFPVPVPQNSGAGTGTSTTIVFKEFGVRLGFLPFILDDETIRLTVDPEVSSIDKTLGTVLVVGGTPVPGLNTRKAHTTVELKQGQTLAIAGLLQLTLDGTTSRIPLLGDLPILGPFFSNTTGDRIEKELVVLITPYLAESMSPGQVPPSPGDEVKEPGDLEFYLLNRLEGRTGRDIRSTTNYDDPLYILRCYMKLEKDRVRGPHGYCE